MRGSGHDDQVRERVAVLVPVVPPILTGGAARALLKILVRAAADEAPVRCAPPTLGRLDGGLAERRGNA